jgi:predicted enzyme related to lactoylglutathione lyase
MAERRLRLKTREYVMSEKIEFLSAVLLVSKDPARLAAFYRDVIGVPLQDESHGGSLPHWGCTLGDIHFAIHPVETFPDRRSGVGAVKLAFTVFDMDALVRKLAAHDVKLLYQTRDTGFFWSTAVEDPDGNFIEFTKMSDDWFKLLEQRHQQGSDVVAHWKATKA